MEADEVLDTNLLMEGKTGLTTAFNVVEYPKALERGVEVLWPERRDFVTAIEIMVGLLRRGTPLPAIDVLIAAMCVNRGLTLATKDEHFEHIRAVRRDFDLRLLE